MKRFIKRKLNNAGSTFIVVIVAISFMAVLGTIIISVSAANLFTKQVEYASKVTFYADEQIMEDIFHGVGKQAAIFFAAANTALLSEMTDDAGEALYDNQEEVFQEFSRLFVGMLADFYGDDGIGERDETVAILRGYIDHDSHFAATELHGYTGTEFIMEVNPSGVDIPFQYVIRGIHVSYEGVTPGWDERGIAEGFRSEITTDIVIEVPYLPFFQGSDNFLDYALVANGGIYFRDSTYPDMRRVYGNVYAGINSASINTALYHDNPVPGGINFANANVTFESNLIVTKGNINLSGTTDVSIMGGSPLSGGQLWAESIRTMPFSTSGPTNLPRLSIGTNRDRHTTDGIAKMDVLLANNLELNASGSDVFLRGGYYGYNNSRYQTRSWVEAVAAGAASSDIANTQSSAIIINGNDASLDLRHLDTLVVNGRGFIDLRRGVAHQEYVTGESLALRPNQFIYLAPSEYLSFSNVPASNPVRRDFLTPAEVANNTSVWIDSPDYFARAAGFVFLTGLGPLEHRDVYEDGNWWRYYYLNLDNENARDFANLILNMTDPAGGGTMPLMPSGAAYTAEHLDDIWWLKQQVDGRAWGAGLDIDIMPVASDARIYASGALAGVIAGAINSDVRDIRSDVNTLDILDANNVQFLVGIENNVHTHFIRLCDYLDGSFVSFATAAGDTGIVQPQPSSERFPLASFLYAGGGDDRLATAPILSAPLIDSGRGYISDPFFRTVVTQNDVEIPPGVNFTGIIISNGDVTVGSGANVRGIIIAAGNIIVVGNGTITADRSVLLAIIDEEVRELRLDASIDTTDSGDYYSLFAIKYLRNVVEPSTIDRSRRVTGTEYIDYMSFANWRRGN